MNLAHSVQNVITFHTTIIDLTHLASTIITVYYMYDAAGAILIDENGMFVLSDEYGNPIGY